MKKTVDQLADELRLSVQGDNFGAGAAPTASACATYAREVDLQFRFMAFFQTLVAVLGALALLLLIWAGYLILQQDSSGANAAVAGVGAIVTGAGALFLTRQRSDARKRFDAAKKAAERCP